MFGTVFPKLTLWRRSARGSVSEELASFSREAPARKDAVATVRAVRQSKGKVFDVHLEYPDAIRPIVSYLGQVLQSVSMDFYSTSARCLVELPQNTYDRRYAEGVKPMIIEMSSQWSLGRQSDQAGHSRRWRDIGRVVHKW